MADVLFFSQESPVIIRNHSGIFGFEIFKKKDF